MRFEWDGAKATSNFEKHGVSFDEAITVWEDPLFVVFADPDHSMDESRLIMVGLSNEERTLVVSFTERSDAIRLISAREATRSEREYYEEEA